MRICRRASGFNQLLFANHARKTFQADGLGRFLRSPAHAVSCSYVHHGISCNHAVEHPAHLASYE